MLRIFIALVVGVHLLPRGMASDLTRRECPLFLMSGSETNGVEKNLLKRLVSALRNEKHRVLLLQDSEDHRVFWATLRQPYLRSFVVRAKLDPAADALELSIIQGPGPMIRPLQLKHSGSGVYVTSVNVFGEAVKLGADAVFSPWSSDGVSAVHLRLL